MSFLQNYDTRIELALKEQLERVSKIKKSIDRFEYKGDYEIKLPSGNIFDRLFFKVIFCNDKKYKTLEIVNKINKKSVYTLRFYQADEYNESNDGIKWINLVFKNIDTIVLAIFKDEYRKVSGLNR